MNGPTPGRAWHPPSVLSSSAAGYIPAAVPASSHNQRSCSICPSRNAFETGLPNSCNQTSPDTSPSADTSTTALPERSSRCRRSSPVSGQRFAIWFSASPRFASPASPDSACTVGDLVAVQQQHLQAGQLRQRPEVRDRVVHQVQPRERRQIRQRPEVRDLVAGQVQCLQAGQLRRRPEVRDLVAGQVQYLQAGQARQRAQVRELAAGQVQYLQVGQPRQRPEVCDRVVAQIQFAQAGQARQRGDVRQVPRRQGRAAPSPRRRTPRPAAAPAAPGSRCRPAAGSRPGDRTPRSRCARARPSAALPPIGLRDTFPMATCRIRRESLTFDSMGAAASLGQGHDPVSEEAFARLCNRSIFAANPLITETVSSWPGIGR